MEGKNKIEVENQTPAFLGEVKLRLFDLLNTSDLGVLEHLLDEDLIKKIEFDVENEIVKVTFNKKKARVIVDEHSDVFVVLRLDSDTSALIASYSDPDCDDFIRVMSNEELEQWIGEVNEG